MYLRTRPNGSVELRIIHRRLPKPAYFTFDSEAQARDYGARLEAALDRGDVPPELAAKKPERTLPMAAVLGAYLTEAPIAQSDVPTVELLRNEVSIRFGELTVRWVDEWIDKMKARRLTPGTIRKRVESLARAVDWWHRREHQADDMPSNPLRTLPRGYSAYRGVEDAPRDARRDRRLHDGEQEKIEAAVNGWKRPDRERPLDMPDREAMLTLFRLIVSTGLRLREAYRLRRRDVQFELRSIHVYKSKRGRTRDVPMSREVFELLQAWPMPPAADDPIFPFVRNLDDEEELTRVTNRLSHRFTTLFEYAGSEGLTEHDLRHEATCRWMLMKDRAGNWMFRPEEVMRITGHVDPRTFAIYLSLRGSDLAVRMW